LTDRSLRSTVGLLVYVAVSTTLAALAALVEGSITPAVAAGALVLAVVPAVLAFRGSRVEAPPPPSRWDLCAIAAFAFMAVRHFGWIAFERDGRLLTADANNYGDLPLHWTYIRYFARGAAFWPENPIFTGARLQYPFGIDLFNGLLVALGVPLGLTLSVVGLVGAGMLGVALFRWGRGFALAAFLFSGGIGTDAAWKNLFLALFVPQRGFLFALPAGLLLLWSWREGLLAGRRRLPSWVEGVVWGVMPLFHLHTFLFVSLVYGLWAVASGRLRECMPAIAWAVVPASWLTYEVTNGFRAASLLWWHPGWTMGSAPLLPFFALNFTLFLPLFVAAAVLAYPRRDQDGLLTLVPGLALFAALFFVMLAPWEWDNTKVMIWCYLLMLPAAERLVIGPLPPVARAVAFLGLLAPGLVAVAGSLGPQQAFEVGEAAEIEDVCRGVAPLPVTARVATSQTFNHPVALCGQPLVAGYSGHLWSHGIKAKPVEEALASLMAGAPGWEEKARVLKARYLFWGPREAAAFPGSTRPWEGLRPVVWDGPFGRLYDLGE
jgi:hypothetical protein